MNIEYLILGALVGIGLYLAFVIGLMAAREFTAKTGSGGKGR